MTQDYRTVKERITKEPGESAAAGSLRELHDALLSIRSAEEFLHELARLAARLVDDSLGCAMTMLLAGKPVTAACTDPLAARLNEVQYALDEGPCLHAMRGGRLVRVEDTAEKARWPRFEAQAAALGIRSCLAVPLTADGQPAGVLSLYAREAAAFGEAESRLAEDFAGNAAGALVLALRLASQAALIEQLRSSLASRAVIDQALGIIMAKERCPQDRAFAIMRAASQNSNVKLREIAGVVVTSMTGELPRPAPPLEERQPEEGWP